MGIAGGSYNGCLWIGGGAWRGWGGDRGWGVEGVVIGGWA